MKVELQLGDDLFDMYKAHVPDGPEKAMVRNLVRFSGVGPTDRVIVVGKAERQELEKLFNGHIEDSKELLNRVKRALSVSVEGVKVSFDPDVVDRLKAQAEFEGMPLKEFLKMKLEEWVSFGA